MKFTGTQKVRLSEKISSAARSDTPLRDLASNFSLVARYALAEANTLTTEKINITLKRLPKNLDGFRIVHLSDIHHSPFTSLEHITRAVEIANSLEPDMFVLTGDFVSHESKYIAPMAKVMGTLKSEFGTFACLGNHDHWTDAKLVTNYLRGENITVLINEGFRFVERGASFWLCGVDDYMVGQTDLRSALRGSFPDEMKILLAHNPKILYRAARASVDLMLSGHTHGGQVKIRNEEKRILPRRKFASGLYRRKGTQVYITRGIGTVVLPVRFGCPPEVSLIELHSI
ncbi:MAG: metallophosphoesterase [Acidobacteria bacterium]|jgi:predicted MPP superfamily phosphohydrolase|nr:metallophosphoesterase [Acidobacteriota bacterium]MBA3786846.1 metallophosphoesterase [Acidobacteriota bacterium]MBA4123061.1 metallophosphoesterase [Acidobacteriota bacterium]